MSAREKTMLTILSARHDILAVANQGAVEALKLDLLDALLDLAVNGAAGHRTTDAEMILGLMKETKNHGHKETHRMVTR